MTCHDRDFMNRTVTRIVEIDGGDLTSWSGDYDFYARERAIQDTQREAAYARQQAMFAKERRFIERFAAHAAKAAQVQSRVKKLDKIEEIEPPRRRVGREVRLPPAAALGRRRGDAQGSVQGLRAAARSTTTSTSRSSAGSAGAWLDATARASRPS